MMSSQSLSTHSEPMRPLMRMAVACLLLVLVASVSGCGVGGRVENPSFPITVDRANEELKAMRATPVRPARPIVVIGGLFDVGIVADDLGGRIKRHTSPSADILVVSPFGTSTIDECRRKVIAKLEERYPSDDPERTVDVDVVGFSLGGVVARFAAMEPGDRAAAVGSAESEPARLAASMKRLNMVRLFSISVPHSGSDAAKPPTLDDRVVAIRPGSAILGAINRRRDVDRGLARAAGSTGARVAAGFELIAYTRLDDRIVDPVRASPPGEEAYWVSNLPFELAHAHAYKDPRIMADMCRKLRNEPGYTSGPPIGVPGSAVVAGQRGTPVTAGED